MDTLTSLKVNCIKTLYTIIKIVHVRYYNLKNKPNIDSKGAAHNKLEARLRRQQNDEMRCVVVNLCQSKMMNYVFNRFV